MLIFLPIPNRAVPHVVSMSLEVRGRKQTYFFKLLIKLLIMGKKKCWIKMLLEGTYMFRDSPLSYSV